MYLYKLVEVLRRYYITLTRLVYSTCINTYMNLVIDVEREKGVKQ